MPKFVQLYEFTDQGIRAFAQTVERVRNAEGAIEKMGGRLESIFWTLGPYDLVSVVEFPDDETATAFSLKLSALGNARVTTLRAFDREEMTKVIAKASG